jgi:AraC family transcriptional regulator
VILPERFEDGRAMLLAGVRQWHGFVESASTIPAQWQALIALGDVPNRIGHVEYGAGCATDLEGQRFEYMAAVEVSSFDGVPLTLGRMRVPAAHYAVFTHDGPLAGLRAVWGRIMGEWFPTSGFQSAPTPDFERYDERFDPATKSGVVEVWIPVTRG